MDKQYQPCHFRSISIDGDRHHASKLLVSVRGQADFAEFRLEKAMISNKTVRNIFL